MQNLLLIMQCFVYHVECFVGVFELVCFLFCISEKPAVFYIIIPCIATVLKPFGFLY